MSDCEKCNQVEKEMAVLKNEVRNFEKQYAEDKLQDKKDLEEIEEGLDALLNQKIGFEAVKEFAALLWKIALGAGGLTWTIIQILKVVRS